MDVCEGHGQCMVVDYDLFPLDDEGYSAVGTDRPVPEGEEDVAQDRRRRLPGPRADAARMSGRSPDTGSCSSRSGWAR